MSVWQFLTLWGGEWRPRSIQKKTEGYYYKPASTHPINHQPTANSTPTATSLLKCYFETNLRYRHVFQNPLSSFLPGRSTKCSQKRHEMPLTSVWVCWDRPVVASPGVRMGWISPLICMWFQAHGAHIHSPVNNIRLLRVTRRPIKMN